MKHYAKWRARSVRKANNGYLEETYAEDLVAGILTDTLAGQKNRWNPGKKSLYQHVEDMIRRRTYHDRKRALRFKHDRIDAPKSTTEQVMTRAMVQASLMQDQPDETAESAIHAQQVIAQLRALAADDKRVLQYLDAIVALSIVRAPAPPPQSPDLADLVDEGAVAARLGVSRSTLQSWRYARRGPRYIKIGRLVRYRNADVDAFLTASTRGDEPQATSLR